VPVDQPVYPACFGQPDEHGNVMVTIGGNRPVTVPWSGSAVDAVTEALDLLEQPDPAIVSEGIYPFAALEDIRGDLTPEDHKAG
jgi:hypothetical protein